MIPATLPAAVASLSADEVVEMGTRLTRVTAELGTLRIGQPADISVLKLEDREWKAVDSQKGTMPAHQAILPVYAIRGDTIYEPLPSTGPD